MIDLIHLIIIGAGILQLPLIMDVIQHLFPQSKLGRAVTDVMRYLLMLCMVFSVSAAVYVHLFVLLKEHVHNYVNETYAVNDLWLLHPQAFGHTLFSLWVYVLLLSNFYSACKRHPSRFQLASAANKANIPLGAAPTKEDEVVCSVCKVPKLLRTHHCRICNSCVELFDHHCPFTGNCVGLRNFRPFFMWVTYGFVGISYATYIGFFPFRYCWYDAIIPGSLLEDEAGQARFHEAWVQSRGAVCERMGRAAFVFLPAFFGWLSTLFIFFFQSLLIIRDVTTVEYLKNITQLNWRVTAPADVNQDFERRKENKTRRKNAASTPGTAVNDDDDEDDVGEGLSTVAKGAFEVEQMEGGASPLASPTSDIGSKQFPDNGAPVSAQSFSYNPHKSFQLLIIQKRPLWTLLVPPFLLSEKPSHARDHSKQAC